MALMAGDAAIPPERSANALFEPFARARRARGRRTNDRSQIPRARDRLGPAPGNADAPMRGEPRPGQPRRDAVVDERGNEHESLEVLLFETVLPKLVDLRGGEAVDLRIVRDSHAPGFRVSIAHADHASSNGQGARSPLGAAPLTCAESAVLRYLPSNLTFPMIAQALFVSRHTVKSHTTSIYRKFGVSSRHEAVKAARGLGLLPHEFVVRRTPA